jgi:predicted metal-dependent phosphoesterase TrpH
MSQAIDLHCHSTVSDGLLTPEELVLNAHRCGVKVLALTDHDDLGGLSIAREVAEAHDIHFIDGVEISVTWKKRTLHIVGLKVDPKNEQLKKELAQVRLDRDQRALEIAEGLAKVGIHGAYEAAKAFAGEAILTRMHFAHFLVENGHAKNTKSVFKKYLVKGKPGFVDHQWMTLDKAVQLIRAAGGDAVIAHPGRYDLGIINTMMLMNEFKGYGGEAIEVVTGSHTPEHFEKYAKIAEKYALKASRGSDFHGKGISFMEMGRLPALPSNCIPVWQNWPEVHAKIAQFV